MQFAELIYDSGFSACGPVRDAASDVMAWGGPEAASDGQVVLSAASQGAARSGARDEREACEVAGAAQ